MRKLEISERNLLSHVNSIQSFQNNESKNFEDKSDKIFYNNYRELFKMTNKEEDYWYLLLKMQFI